MKTCKTWNWKLCKLAALAFACVAAHPARADDWPEGNLEPINTFEMVAVPAGCYEMGDFTGKGDVNEHPQHTACVKAFELGKFPVSQMEWISVMGKNPSANVACGGFCPVENVSWNEVRDFIKRLNARGSAKYRLPTEAEWEYAARSGGKAQAWAGTSDEAELGEYAWYIENAVFQAHPVGKKKPNGLGLYDMSGNVWQWTADWYAAGYDAHAVKQNPQGPRAGKQRALRGGYWGSPSRMLRTTRRIGLMPDAKGPGFGLRLVRITS